MYSQALRYAFSSRADLGNLEISGFCTDVTQIVRVFLLKMFPEALSMTLPSLVFSALPNKWNLQIYCFSLFIGRNVFQSTLQVRFMVRKFNSSFLVLKLMVTKKDNFSICGRGFKFSTPKIIRRFDQ